MFIDRAKIFVRAGKGGDGCNSFYRDRQVRRGKPNGGNGGDGGDVIFEADPNIRTLYDFRYNHHFHAERGGHGSSNNKKGRRGQNLVVRIPPGTVIIEDDTKLILRDLTELHQSVIVSKGGKEAKVTAVDAKQRRAKLQKRRSSF